MRKPIFAIDFDGTIVKHNFPDIGHVRYAAKECITWIHEWANIIIWTCRMNDDKEQASLWLLFNHIPFDKINENMESISFNPYPKIYYDYLIDDRNLGGVKEWPEIWEECRKIKKEWTDDE